MILNHVMELWPDKQMISSNVPVIKNIFYHIKIRNHFDHSVKSYDITFMKLKLLNEMELVQM